VDEAISLAKKLNDMSALALVLQWATNLAYYGRNPAEVERLASVSIELSTRLNFARWLTLGTILRGWARSASGDTAQGIAPFSARVALERRECVHGASKRRHDAKYRAKSCAKYFASSTKKRNLASPNYYPT
jgi:hypothetical protein